MSPTRAPPPDRPAADRRLRRPARCRSNCRSLAREFGLGGVDSVRAQHRRAGAGRGAVASRRRGWCPTLPPWVSVDQEGGRVARLKAPFTEWPPMATLGRSGDVALAERFARALASELQGRRHHARLRAGARRPHQSEEPGHRRSRACRARPRTSRGSARAIVRALQGEGVAACGKHFPGHGDTSDRFASRAAARRASARSAARRRVRAVQGGDRRRRRHDHDGARVRAGARREAAGDAVAAHRRPDLLREELGFEGVILSDDLEMKAIADHYAVPDGRGAGDRGRLRRRADLQRRPRHAGRGARGAVHAVEDERLPLRARRGRAEAAAAREGALPRGAASRARPLAAARALRRACSAATSTARSPTRWRASCDAEAARARRRAIASPSSLPPARSTATSSTAASRKSGGSGSSRSTTNRCSRGSGMSPGSPERARRGDSRGLARSVDRRHHRRARRLRQRAAAAAARSRRGAAGAQAVHRLQRSHVAPDVPDDRLRARRVSRSDARRPARPRRGRLRSRDRSLSGAVPARAAGRAGAAAARDRSARAKRPACCSAAR